MVLMVLITDVFVFSGNNWLKGTCNFSLWINNVAKLLKHMLHHLHNIRYGFLWTIILLFFLVSHFFSFFATRVLTFMVLSRFQETRTLPLWFLLPQNLLMLGRLHRSCMLLSLVPSQVSLLHSLSLCLLFFHFAFSICFPFLLFCLVSSNMFRICLTLSFVLMISYLETTPSITLP